MHPVLFSLSLPLWAVRTLLVAVVLAMSAAYAWREGRADRKNLAQILGKAALFPIVAAVVAFKVLTAQRVGDPVALPLHTYGLMLATGFMIGMQLGVREARRVDVTKEKDFDQFIMDLTFWILIVAIAGSRILFIIVEWDKSYSRDPWKIFRILEGGFVFYGGFIASVAFSAYFSWRKRRDFFLVSDTLIPSVALGHFFGRLGCFAAGCCWGGQVDPNFLFAVRFPPGSLAYNTMRSDELIDRDALHSIPVHPVQIYEASGELLLFFILLLMRTQKRFHGQVLVTYLFLYPILRFSLELIRDDKARGVDIFLGMSTSQTISAATFTTAAIITAYLLRASKRRTSAPPAPALT